jgi:hypothetical protein
VRVSRPGGVCAIEDQLLLEILHLLAVEGWGLRVEGWGLRVEGWGLRVEGWGLRVEGW